MSDQPEQMRTLDEVQRAHDMMVGIILGDIENPFHAKSMKSLEQSADVLCWVLKHGHNEEFGKNLKEIEDYCQEKGIQIARDAAPRGTRAT